jgi:dTDP-4-amino-4,6-dideoxygalactose transaminase
MQAGWMTVKLKRLDEWNERRRALAEEYAAALEAIDEVRPVSMRPENRSSFHLYVIRTKRREPLQAYLRERGIATGIHYPIPLHLQPCYRRLGLPAGSFPHAEQSCSEVLSLPMFPEMDESQVRHVAAAVELFVQRSALRKAI